MQRSRFNRICEPTSDFRIVITTSKNNVWMTAQAVRKRAGEEGSLWRHVRTLFKTNAGCVGIRKCRQQRKTTPFTIGHVFGRKCKRFGIAWADVVYRQAMRIPEALNGLKINVGIKSITHIPRLPKGLPPRRRKRRRI